MLGHSTHLHGATFVDFVQLRGKCVGVRAMAAPQTCIESPGSCTVRRDRNAYVGPVLFVAKLVTSETLVSQDVAF